MFSDCLGPRSLREFRSFCRADQFERVAVQAGLYRFCRDASFRTRMFWAAAPLIT